MQFTKHLHNGIKRGDINCTIRIWKRLHVKLGGAYKLGSGHVLVDDIHEIALDDITPELARRSGFAGVVDLLKTAKHGSGEKVYLIDFHYEQ